MSGLSLISYSPILLSHQTNLSITASTANIGYDIGTPIIIPRNGIAKITLVGHVNGGNGLISLNLTRENNTYNLGIEYSGGGSLFANSYSGNGAQGSITATQPTLATYSISSNPIGISTSNPQSQPFVLEILVLKGDILQFQAGNSTAGDITYIDDLVVILQ